MLDCGCNENVDKDLLQQVADQAKTCHLILLSHSTYQHLGALPFYFKSNM